MTRRPLLSALLSAWLLLPVAYPVLAEESADQVAYFRAAQMDNDRTVREVLARGLNPNVREPERGETGLVVAMRYDANKVLAELLKHPQVNLEEASANGTTALMMASFKQNKVAVQALIGKGAQVNRKGWTPLHFAATAGDLEIMAILLERYAYIDAASPTGFTPLMLAAREGKEEAVQLLLREGADATIKDFAFHIDAAEFARRADKPWIAKAIESHQAATAVMNGK
ncbi:MAG: ankyrin repeat domain-containing protein [Burkholderiaceae bacterium]|nr:ankyrin repeat domain-containing protein [Burkholderiaceae bacterium]